MRFFSKKNHRHNGRGFTLLELLVVVSILGLLAMVIMGSLNEARTKGRDTDRIQVLKEMQKAIELYYSDNGYYPPLTSSPANDARSGTTLCSDNVNSGNAGWCDLMNAIAPYYKGGDGDPRNISPNLIYYDADGSEPAYYGLMAMFEASSNDDLAQEDGGFYCASGACASNTRGYEIGNEPRYCMDNGWGDWRVGGTRMCASVSSPTPP